MTKPAKWFECIHGYDHEPCPECDKEPEWSKEHDSPAEYELAQKLKAANERIAKLEDALERIGNPFVGKRADICNRIAEEALEP